MGSLERRLCTLERAASVPDPEEREQRLRRDVLRRMTDRELERYEEAMLAGEWHDEELPILRRIEELTEEVAADSSAGEEEIDRKEQRP